MVRLWFSFTNVFNGESGIPKDLKEEAQTFFEDMNVKLEWPDLYNKSVNILNVQRHEYSFGEPKSLTAPQVDEWFWWRAVFIDTQETTRQAQEQNDRGLKLGASIGVQEKQASGTLGAIVKSGSTYYALSCDHVMKSENSRRIVHPGHSVTT